MGGGVGIWGVESAYTGFILATGFFVAEPPQNDILGEASLDSGFRRNDEVMGGMTDFYNSELGRE